MTSRAYGHVTNDCQSVMTEQQNLTPRNVQKHPFRRSRESPKRKTRR